MRRRAVRESAKRQVGPAVPLHTRSPSRGAYSFGACSRKLAWPERWRSYRVARYWPCRPSRGKADAGTPEWAITQDTNAADHGRRAVRPSLWGWRQLPNWSLTRLESGSLCSLTPARLTYPPAWPP